MSDTSRVIHYKLKKILGFTQNLPIFINNYFAQHNQIRNFRMDKPYNYLIVGEDHQERLYFVNSLNKQQRQSKATAYLQPIHRTLYLPDNQISIADYPIQNFKDIYKNEHCISGIIALINQSDMENLKSIGCKQISNCLQKIFKLYCSKIRTQQQSIDKQPKLILASLHQSSYQANIDIYQNINRFLTKQFSQYVERFKYEKAILKKLIINKLGQWKIRENYRNTTNIKLIQRQLKDFDFQLTQSSIQEQNQYYSSNIKQRQLSANENDEQTNQLLNLSTLTQGQLQLKPEPPRKQHHIQKETCFCQLV